MDPIPYSNPVERRICDQATRDLVPINAIFELTPLCNMNCDMCFVRLSPGEMHARGSLLPVSAWISLADELKSRGTLFVLLTGGEPLTYPGFRELYLHLMELGMILTINTNGTLIDEDWVRFFEANRPRRINITLYGKDADTYEKLCHHREGYERAIHAIRALHEVGVDVKVNGSITPSNVGDLQELVDQVEQIGCYWKFDTYMYPASRERGRDFASDSRLSPADAARARVALMKRRAVSREDFLQMAASYLHTVANTRPLPGPQLVGCRAGKSSFCVNWQGKMRPCVIMTEPEVELIATEEAEKDENAMDRQEEAEKDENAVDRQEETRESGAPETSFAANHNVLRDFAAANRYVLSDFTAAWEQLVSAMHSHHLSPACSTCPGREVCITCAACGWSEEGAIEARPRYVCEYTRETVRLLEQEYAAFGQLGPVETFPKVVHNRPVGDVDK